jgi:non-ribosomal peptide synthetase component F
LLAGFGVLLSWYSGEAEVVVGTDVANRLNRETEDIIGFFINQLVMRIDLSGNLTFRELLKHVREVALDAYAHQDLPFDLLVKALRPERDFSRSPLFQVKFALQNFPLPVIELSDITLTPLEIKMERAELDLTLFMWESESGLKGSLEYNTDLFDREMVSQMSGHFKLLLSVIAERADIRLDELLEIIDESELNLRAVETKEQSQVERLRNIKLKPLHLREEELLRVDEIGCD